MEYFVQRGETRYGPYRLTDLQRYVDSGNISLDDLVQSDGLTSLVPVAEVLDIPIPARPAPVIEPETVEEPVPLPPNLHWALVLALALLSQNLFTMAWVIVQGNWARKLSGSSTALFLVSTLPVGAFVGGIVIGAAATASGAPETADGLLAWIIAATFIPYIIGIFKIKAAMEDHYTSSEDIGLRLSPVMTFFFHVVYFQYHINRIARWRKTGTLDGSRNSTPLRLT